MKKLLLALLLFFSITVSAQFNYQSTIKYSNGQLVTNKIIPLRFSIRLGSATGTTVYRELQHPLANSQGNVVVAVGTGKAELGNFSQINWAQGNHYLTVEF